MAHNGWCQRAVKSMLHERAQHPVGQGFFHTAVVNGDGGPVNYVVDCGSMKKYAVARKTRIRAYIRDLSPNRDLDILFITHFHVDHISGIEELLDAKKGLRVDTIVMPLLNDVDRLIAFARSYVEDRGSADTEFYRAFVEDPSSAVSRFNPRRVIFVRSGGGDGGAPGSTDSPLGPPDFKLPEGHERASGWKFTGRGGVERYPHDFDVQNQRTESLIIPDTVAAVVSHTVGHWLLAPFVDPGVSANRTTFLQALAKERGLSLAKLKSWLGNAGNLKILITTDAADLVAAYHSMTTDLNITSLCLYSGPATKSSLSIRGVSLIGTEVMPWWLPANRLALLDGRVAWLGTGDAALASGARRKAFLKHYGKLIDNVGVFTLPHHGSEHNFHVELLRKINPVLSVAAAEKYSNWRHPSAHIVQAICSHGSAIHVVTSKPPSQLRDYVRAL